MTSGTLTAYQGAPGAFSEQAAWALAGADAPLLPCDTLPDVFASTANYLRRVGWRPGLEWGGEVPSGTPVGQGERIVKPAGANGPAYRTTENFRVILRWNQSDFFGLAVGLLSDRIAA